MRTCAICGCRDDDACPEVCHWIEEDTIVDGPPVVTALVPLCSSCERLALELGRMAIELTGARPPRGSDRRARREKHIGWALVTWLTLETDGPGAVLDRWAQAEKWAEEPGGLLEGRKVWWAARGSKPPKTRSRRKGVEKR